MRMDSQAINQPTGVQCADAQGWSRGVRHHKEHYLHNMLYDPDWDYCAGDDEKVNASACDQCGHFSVERRYCQRTGEAVENVAGTKLCIPISIKEPYDPLKVGQLRNPTKGY